MWDRTTLPFLGRKLRLLRKRLRYSLSDRLIPYYELGSEATRWVLPRRLPDQDLDGFVPSRFLATAWPEHVIQEQLDPE